MYDVLSSKAEEFISHQEIIDTLIFANENKSNVTLINQILEKAALQKGLNHREASVLLACDLPEQNQVIEKLAMKIKSNIYGKRIVMFAPLYLSNYCVNGCTYCPYHLQNKTIPRKKLTQREIQEEVKALQDMGHKRLALEAGEDPLHNTMDYYLESIKTIYDMKHKNGAIRRVNVNIAATSVENYWLLKEAEVGTYLLFQETYHKESYEKLHPTGPKKNYTYHTEALDRAMQGGLDDVGIGVLFGLDNYDYEFAGLLMHAQHLEAAFGVGPHTISVPRLRAADGIDTANFNNGINDDIFAKIVACLRIAQPYAGMILSTRESKNCRERLLKLGISQISGGSKTSVGGYSKINNESQTSGIINYLKPDIYHSNSAKRNIENLSNQELRVQESSAQKLNVHEMITREKSPRDMSALKLSAQEMTPQEKNPRDMSAQKLSAQEMTLQEKSSRDINTQQFEVSDNRTLDEVVTWLMELGYVPSFCTACYREGRTGDRFMALCKSGQLQNCCHPNSLMTLKEYEMDYASNHSKALANQLIRREIHHIPNPKVKRLVQENLELLEKNQGRDFRL